MEPMKKVAAAGGAWAGLPSELLLIIHGKLENCREIISFRSVCRWWRLSTPPPLNKISGLFPLRPSFLGKEEKPSRSYDYVVNATAVYLVRSRNKPATAWMVSVHEESAGNLILRHPLSYLKIPNNNGYLEEGEIERITATQNPISRSYNYNNRCICKAVAIPLKVEFILETGSGSGGAQLAGLSSSLMQEVSTFRMDMGGETTATLSQFKGETFFHDFVRFKEHIFALHPQGTIYVLDRESLLLIQTNGGIPKPSLNWRYIRFVVSDDQLYVVVLYYQEEDQECLTCLIYRIQVDSMCELTCEQVEDLGDEKVFFIGVADCFSVSARDLPPPWKPNCVVFSGIPHSVCGCPLSASDTFYNDPEVFFLETGGLQHSATVSSLPPAYSHLFYPPAK